MELLPRTVRQTEKGGAKLVSYAAKIVPAEIKTVSSEDNENKSLR
jgi:hypothetical protein